MKRRIFVARCLPSLSHELQKAAFVRAIVDQPWIVYFFERTLEIRAKCGIRLLVIRPERSFNGSTVLPVSQTNEVKEITARHSLDINEHGRPVYRQYWRDPTTWI